MRSLPMLVSIGLMTVACSDAREWSFDGDAAAQGAEGESRVIFQVLSTAMSMEAVVTAIVACGGEVYATFPELRAIAAVVTPSCVAEVDHSCAVDHAPDVLFTTMGDSEMLMAASSLPEIVPFGAWRIGMDLAWQEYGLGQGARIAIIDTGVDCEHSAFGQRITHGVDVRDEAGSAGAYSFCVDENGHGTAVVGIIAAQHDDVGAMGALPDATIWPVKAFAANGTASATEIVRGVLWSVEQNADVLLLPFGGFNDSPLLDQALAYALAEGVIVVIAAGNTGDGDPLSPDTLSPSDVPGVIGVAATDDMDSPWFLSASGEGVFVVAPGAYEYTTFPGDIYAFTSGTSFAAARVAAVAGMVRSRFPLVNPEAFADVLARTADDLGDRDRDPVFGEGLVDVLGILRYLAWGWEM